MSDRPYLLYVLDNPEGAAATIDALTAERDALQAKVDAIDALHRPMSPDPDNFPSYRECAHYSDLGGFWASVRYPCPTALALHPEGDTPNGV